MLFNIALPFMTLRLDSKVVSLEPSGPSLTLESGEVIAADVIIGADGIKSTVRETVVGGPDKPVPTGDAAYRAIVPTSEMLNDPDLKELVDCPEMTGWLGPNKHVVAYCIVRTVSRKSVIIIALILHLHLYSAQSHFIISSSAILMIMTSNHILRRATQIK
jgi:salicylate hydroxylase